MHFLLDANMPRSAIDAIRAAGHDCTHVRDTALANASDDQISTHAQQQCMTLISRDFDFADPRRYPPERFSGIVVLTVPDTASATLISQLVSSFLAQPECIAALPGRLAVVEFGRVRLRPRPPNSG